MAKKRKKTNTGKPFENLTETATKLFATDDSTVESNVHVPTEFGDRQFDVMLTRTVPPFGEVKIAIEARDRSRKGSVTQLDAFKSKLDDCSATVNKGIIINRLGFTANAKKKALRNGIQLFRLEDREHQILDSAFALPVVIQEHRVGHTLFEGNIYSDSDKLLRNPNILLNGMPYNQFCLSAIYKKKEKLKKVTKIVESITEIDISGEKFTPLNLTMTIVVATRYHFGYVNELPNSIILKSETNDSDRAIVDSAEIMKKYEFRKWPWFFDVSDAPSHLGIIMCGSIKPTLQDEFTRSIFEGMRKK